MRKDEFIGVNRREFIIAATNSFFLLQKNTGQNGGKPKLDLNVGAAWALGVTGKNVTTAIMDDGEWDC